MQTQYRGETSTQYIIYTDTESRLYPFDQLSKQEQQRLKVDKILINSKNIFLFIC